MPDPKGGMGMNMVTTVMAFSVSAFFVLFVFTRLLCARLHLSRAAAAARAAGDAFVVVQPYNVERGIHGLEPSVVTSFPTVKLGDGGGGPQRPPVQEESQCTVCLEEYEPKDVVRVLPACGHAFHAPCIDAWLRQHPTCPVCRASLRAKNTPHAPPIDYRLLVAAGAAARPPVAAASSSDPDASPQQAVVGRQQADVPGDGLLEIISEEPAAASGDQSPVAAAAAGRNRSRCGDAGASEHC
ncbi:hypothetical protein BS78_04G149800 [Paspalum vaginatum]|nr:hypothetical protein BS78_04G149800 [Paspalum vaginatum]